MRKYARIFIPVLGALIVAASIAATSVNSNKTGISTGASAPLTLAAGSTAVSAPIIDASQTWTDAAVTFRAFLINITDTASAAASMFADFQVGGVSKASISKAGVATAASYTATGGPNVFPYVQAHAALENSASYWSLYNAGVTVYPTGMYGFSATAGSSFVNWDLAITRKSAGRLQINSGTLDVYRDVEMRNLITTAVQATNAAAPTIASATTIAPTTAIVFVSGTTTIETITAPSPISAGGGRITIIPTGVFLTGVTGNIALASTSVASKALTMTYDVTTAKWYPSY